MARAGRAELELGLNREAASDFMKGLNLLNQRGETNNLACATLRMLIGQSELMQAQKEVAVNPSTSLITTRNALQSLARAEKELGLLLSTEDWHYADVSDLFGAAMVLEAQLKGESTDFLNEAQKKLIFALDTLLTTSRYPDSIRQKRLQRSEDNFATLQRARALLQTSKN